MKKSAATTKRDIQIVPFERKYRDMVRRCVYETGFGGETAEIYFEDLDLFADLNVLYYTDYEPESAFIGLVDGEPAGYLLGCTDTKRFDSIFAKEIAPHMLKGLVAGRYNVGPGVRRNLSRGLLMIIRGEAQNPPIDAYPAHLHIDLFKPYRRFGLGSRLVLNYFDFLRDRGIHGVHLNTSSAHTLALPFYEKLGFRRYSVSRAGLSLFREIIDKDFYNICYVKHI